MLYYSLVSGVITYVTVLSGNVWNAIYDAWILEVWSSSALAEVLDMCRVSEFELLFDVHLHFLGGDIILVVYVILVVLLFSMCGLVSGRFFIF